MKPRNLHLLYSVAVCAALCLIGTARVYPQQPEAEWTWLIYMDSDNNLEAPQMHDIQEMMAVGSTANVNIVMLVDRSDKDDRRDSI